MTWTILQSASTAATATAATTAAATYGSNVASGTKLICVVGYNSGGSQTVSSVKDGAGNSFTQAAFISSGGSATGIYFIDTPAGDVGTKPVITATFSSTVNASVWIAEVSGLAVGNTTALALDGTAATAGFAASASDAQPAYSSSVAGEMLLVAEGDDGGPQTVTQPAGYTLDVNSVTNNADADAATATKNSTGGAESGTWTFGGTTTATVLAVIAFKVAAGAPPGTGRPLQAAVQPPQPPPPPPGRVISAPVAYRPVVTLSGSGTLTAGPGVGGQPQLITSIAQPPQPAQPPAARLIGVTPAAFISGATLSGSGTLTASYTVTGVPSPVIQPVAQPPQPPQPPPGQITGSAPVITYTVGASLSGSGTLTAAWTVYGIPPYVTTPVAQPPQPAPPPPGRVISAPPALLGSAALTGSGTLAAAPFFSAAAVLSGAGTLTAGPGAGGFPVIIQAPLPQPAQPPLPPPGRVLQAPPALLLGSATLAGSGTLAALPFFSAAAALSGQGTLTAAYTVAGAPPYIIVAVIQPPAPAQPPPGRLLGVPPPPPPPVLQSATIAATVSDQATTTATVSEQASITASVT